MAASPLPQAQLPIHAVAKRIATLHAKWAEPAHPPGLLHRSGEWERTARIKVTSGVVMPCRRYGMHGALPLPQARLQSAPRVNDLSGWLGCAARARCAIPLAPVPVGVPLLWRSPPNYANRPLGVASCPPAPLGLAAPRSGQTGAALRLLRFARRGSDSGLEPSHSPLRALILGGVRRGAPCGGPKSALRTPPAVQSPGGVGGLRPLA